MNLASSELTRQIIGKICWQGPFCYYGLTATRLFVDGLGCAYLCRVINRLMIEWSTCVSRETHLEKPGSICVQTGRFCDPINHKTLPHSLPVLSALFPISFSRECVFTTNNKHNDFEIGITTITL